jgi:hypothetical protein
VRLRPVHVNVGLSRGAYVKARLPGR